MKKKIQTNYRNGFKKLKENWKRNCTMMTNSMSVRVTWNLHGIKLIINKKKIKSELPDEFKENEETISHPKEITKKFN